MGGRWQHRRGKCKHHFYPILSDLTRETGTRIHPYYFEKIPKERYQRSPNLDKISAVSSPPGSATKLTSKLHSLLDTDYGIAKRFGETPPHPLDSAYISTHIFMHVRTTTVNIVYICTLTVVQARKHPYILRAYISTRAFMHVRTYGDGEYRIYMHTNCGTAGTEKRTSHGPIYLVPHDTVIPPGDGSQKHSVRTTPWPTTALEVEAQTMRQVRPPLLSDTF